MNRLAQFLHYAQKVFRLNKLLRGVRDGRCGWFIPRKGGRRRKLLQKCLTCRQLHKESCGFALNDISIEPGSSYRSDSGRELGSATQESWAPPSARILRLEFSVARHVGATPTGRLRGLRKP